jgi:apolipoprotein D and lipocalin family protein
MEAIRLTFNEQLDTQAKSTALFNSDTDALALRVVSEGFEWGVAMIGTSRKASRRAKSLVAGGAMLVLSACIGSPGPVGNIAVPEPARPVELTSYLGKWYEYGRYEAPFQKGCEGVTAEYSLRDDGKIRVINSCYRGSLDGEFDQATGKAKLVGDSNNAKLRVSFFGPFYGDYWVLDRGEEDPQGKYSWSIVGEPSGRYLWMLTREAQPDTDLRAFLERRVRELGYDWSLVRLTKQPS